MDLVHRTTSASVADASFDTLARTMSRRLQRRQMFGLLAATVASGVLGVDAAAKSKSRNASLAAQKKKGGKKGGGRRGGGGGTTAPQPVPAPAPAPAPAPQPQPLPPALPDASQNCRAAGNQCGTNAGIQGTCRVAVAADNQAGFLCTSNTAGNTCVASTQCGAGTRCVIQGAAQTCRVVIG